MVQAWHFLGSTPLRRLGKLTLREDAWWLPSGDERRYPVLHVGTTVGIVPFVDAGHVLSSASSVTSPARSPGSCRAAADSRARTPRRRRSVSSGKRPVIAQAG